MRKESGFDPHDVSYADAIGLLQMIPPTSRRVGERIHHAYTDDVLYDPAGNVEFGAWYIGQLFQKFKRQVPIGAGSFNAGPKPMMRWMQKHGRRPMDEFVELCAYTQTREYMKLVTDNYAHYLYLYSGKLYELPLTVDASPVENEINY
jgi:soluble lytic murein transglycosylase